jgi:hypothetical protein
VAHKLSADIEMVIPFFRGWTMRHHRLEELRTSLLNAFRTRGERPVARSPDAASTLDETTGPCFEFYWSARALRVTALAVAGLTVAALPAVMAEPAGLRVLGVLWLTMMIALAHGLACRARTCDPVVTIDALGITDRRLLARRVYWQDIAAFDRTDLERAQTIEFFLKRPELMVPGCRLGLRIGAWLQWRLGLPAATINLILIDASATDVARAVAEFRPGLLPIGMLPGSRSISR